MRFVLVLHAHLPYVLNHGRWPHGSDWLCEAALDTYLPLLEQLRALRRDRVPAPVTLGVTPILAQQLGHPTFAAEFRAFLAQRLTACDEAERDLPGTPDAHLVPVARWWKTRWTRLAALFETLDGDLVGEFRAHAAAGRLELLSSAATHGFLPLLARDESIRLQLAVGRAAHSRLFGRAAEGCWLPECAYRPAGPWAPWPTAPGVRHRPGIESFLAEAGYRYTVVDAHLVRAGRPLGLYAHAPTRPWARALDAGVRDDADARSPYRDWRIGHHARRRAVRALVRDPRSSFQIWSREGGYPGDGRYLEFHKIRYPGGLKLWRVTGTRVDLGAKEPYEPSAAALRAQEHARHFVDVLHAVVAREGRTPGHEVIVAPFDAELFGHWWAEGVDFLGALYRALAGQEAVVPLTAAAHAIASGEGATAIALPPGSWGKDGDWTMWLSPLVAWTWERLWPLEERFWRVAPRAARGDGDALAVLAQAARELLLAQSSDWQFIISTGEVADYATERFTGHADACDRLLAALEADAAGRVAADAAALRARDDVFPDVLDQVRAVVARQTR